MANAQTIATRKYQQSKGIIKKSYTLERTLTEDFKKACDMVGLSQSAAIRSLMQEFIAKANEQQKEAPQ